METYIYIAWNGFTVPPLQEIYAINKQTCFHRNISFENRSGFCYFHGIFVHQKSLCDSEREPSPTEKLPKIFDFQWADIESAPTIFVAN